MAATEAPNDNSEKKNNEVTNDKVERISPVCEVKGCERFLFVGP